MIKLTYIIILFGTILAQNIFAQDRTISVHYDPMHYFFFENDIYSKRTDTDLSHVPFYNLVPKAFGIEYTKGLNEKSRLGIELNYFRNFYNQHYQGKVHSPVIGYHHWLTLGVNYSREKLLSDKFNFRFGGGVNYRYGWENIIIARIPLTQFGGFEILSESGLKSDFGINAFGQIDYSFSKKWFVYSKVDFLGFFYLMDREFVNRMKNDYDLPHYPTRLDLSLKVGIGVRL